MVSRAEIDELYHKEKIIKGDWSWKPAGSNYEGEATVFCVGTSERLTLRAWKRRNYGFCLLYKSSKVVRRWDDGIHTNPDGEVIEGSHKHRWDPDYEDLIAYEVDDVATDDVDQAFHDFLDECNISLEGNYYRQTGLSES